MTGNTPSFSLKTQFYLLLQKGQTMPPIPANRSVTYSDTPVIKADDNIELSFKNEVIAGAGDIILSNGSDTRIIAITDTSQITFSRSKFGHYSVIIDPTQDLVPNTHYSIQMASGVIMDSTGYVNAAIADPETLSFNTTDSAPLLAYSNIDSSSSDSGLLAELAADDSIRLHFDENVVPGNGNIILSNGLDTRVIDVHDASQVIFDSEIGRSVIINPAADLIPNMSYHVQIASGAITDTAGNAYSGINDPDTPSFAITSADPELLWSSLWNEESTLKVDGDILLYFGEAVTAGSGAIIISNGSDTRTIDITDASQVTFKNFLSSVDVVIKPSVNLIPGTSYSIQMAAGVITDDTGHVFRGIEPETMNFTTIASSPRLYAINSVDQYGLQGEVTVKADDAIMLQFDEKVLPGNGEIVISNGTDTRIIDIHDSSQVTFDDYGEVFIKPSCHWILDTPYTVRIAAGVVTDSDGNAFAGTADQSGFSFTPVESNPLLGWTNFMVSDQPLLSAINLSHEKLTLRSDSGIQLHFDEQVMAGNGKIIIGSDSDIRIINIHDTSQVIFDEHGDVSINPVENLLPHTLYHIEIANGVITDTAGNPYEGFHDATDLEFTTTDPYFITMTGVDYPDIMVP